jgi:hypothetical protein
MGGAGGVLGYEAKITIPATITKGRRRKRRRKRRRAISVKARGRTPTGALAKAAGLADRLAKNPILASVLPPGTGTAIKATKFLARAALKGKLGKALSFVKGAGAKRLGKALKKFKFW